MRIGLAHRRGDCPGLNAAIRAIVLCAENDGDEVIGFHHGWLGVAEDECATLTEADTKGLLQTGGTILRTARYHPEKHEGGTEAVLTTFARERLDAFVVIGETARWARRSNSHNWACPRGHRQDNRQRCHGYSSLHRVRHGVATAAEAIDRVKPPARATTG